MRKQELKLGYRCGYCKNRQPGQAVVQVMLKGKLVSMCSVECVCAAQCEEHLHTHELPKFYPFPSYNN